MCSFNAVNHAGVSCSLTHFILELPVGEGVHPRARATFYFQEQSQGLL